MAHHRALRAAGRARGEDDVRDVGAVHGTLERGTAGQKIGFQLDDRYPRRRGVVLAEESLLHQDGLRRAAGDDVGRFVGLEPGVDRHQHPTRGQQPERRDDPLRRIGRPDRDPIALIDTQISESACGATYSLDSFGKGEAQRTVDDRLPRRRSGPPRSRPSRGWCPTVDWPVLPASGRCPHLGRFAPCIVTARPG